VPLEYREADGVIGVPEARAARNELRTFNRFATQAHEAARSAGLEAALGDIELRLRQSQEIANDDMYFDMHLESEELQAAWTNYGELEHWVADGLWEGLAAALERPCAPIEEELRCDWARHRAMDAIGATLAQHRRESAAPDPAGVEAWLTRLLAAFRRNNAAGMVVWESGSRATELAHPERMREAIDAAGACSS
jgi:hypothetical protein